MTPNRLFFYTYEKVDGGNVSLGKDDTCKVVGIGSMAIKMHDVMIRVLNDVRHVPGLKKKSHIPRYNGCFGI